MFGISILRVISLDFVQSVIIVFNTINVKWTCIQHYIRWWIPCKTKEYFHFMDTYKVHNSPLSIGLNLSSLSLNLKYSEQQIYFAHRVGDHHMGPLFQKTSFLCKPLCKDIILFASQTPFTQPLHYRVRVCLQDISSKSMIFLNR